MIDYIVTLFTNLFTACLQFSEIIYFLSACALCSVVATAIVYLVKGRY